MKRGNQLLLVKWFIGYSPSYHDFRKQVLRIVFWKRKDVLIAWITGLYKHSPAECDSPRHTYDFF